MQKSVVQMTLFSYGRRDLKQTSVRGGAELSGSNTNLEDVSKVLRTQASNRRETDVCVVDSLTDWKPVGRVRKRRNVLLFS